MDLTPILIVLIPAVIVLLVVLWRRSAASTTVEPGKVTGKVGGPPSRSRPQPMDKERDAPIADRESGEISDVVKSPEGKPRLAAASAPRPDKTAKPSQPAAARPRKPVVPAPLERAAPLPPAPDALPGSPPSARTPVNFTAFYPRTVQPDTRYSLIAYAHLLTALNEVQKDAARFTDELGGSVPAPRTAKDAAQVMAGQPITMVPECDGLDFDPPTLTRKWDAPHTRYEFAFKPGADLAGDELHGRISVQIAGFEVANVKFAIEVAVSAAGPSPTDTAPTAFMRPMTTSPMTTGTPSNPLAAAKLTASQPATMYNRIFVSYSRKDAAVAEAFRLAQLALGNEVFMDTYSIRTGENWQAALAKAIDTADIFQLFWSAHAAESPNVHDEWDYALKYRCPNTRCADFIRPVYWEQPLPVPPPPELGHLNFRFVPLKS